MQALPSIWEQMDETDRKRVRFIKPSVGNDLTKLRLTDSTLSPGVKAMAISKLKLQVGTVIPFHCHEQKEKIYIHAGNCTITVFIFIGGQIQKYELRQRDNFLVIPAGCPHAVQVHGIVHGMQSDLMIISSTNNPDDIAWETATEELLLNNHLPNDRVETEAVT